MLLLSLKTNLALLWGISVLLSTESMSASIPETSSINSTAEPNKTISSYVAHNETELQPVTLHSTRNSAEVSAPATAETTASSTVETEEAIVTYSSDSSKETTNGLVATNTAAAIASSSGPSLPHASTAAATATDEAQPSHSTTISETAESTEDHFHQQSPTALTGMTSSSATTSTASLSTEITSTTEPEVRSISSSTPSPFESAQTSLFIQNPSSPSVSTTSTMTTNPTSEAAPVSDATSSTVTLWETSTNSADLSSASQPVSATTTHSSTSEFINTVHTTAEPHTISFSTDSANNATANTSTSPAGIFIPRVPKKLPIPTTQSTTATYTAPSEVSKTSPITEVQPCSNKSMAKQCLIAIASLAGLATIFMVSTVILCAKLSSRKYKVKKPQQDTEMMCISALLPDRSNSYRRQRNPVTNGVLVIHGRRDSDEDGGDNLTLSSFLPENDRIV